MRDISDFEREWPGGYFEGDPRDPFGSSTYLTLGYISVLYATYLTCIKPHVTSNTAVLEIGPGRGAWTKAILSLGPAKVWALDAASDEHSGFTKYVGRSPVVEHHQVQDESLSEVPDNSVDLFFSFGVFCHLPAEIVGRYLASLWSKMTPGSHGYFMVADFDQHDKSVTGPNAIESLFALRRFAPQRVLHQAMVSMFPAKLRGGLRHDNPDSGASQWYDIGKDGAAHLAELAGFTVVTTDVGTCPRDPVLHITKD